MQQIKALQVLDFIRIQFRFISDDAISLRWVQTQLCLKGSSVLSKFTVSKMCVADLLLKPRDGAS